MSWIQLYETQTKNLEDKTCRLWRDGTTSLGITPDKCPTATELTQVLYPRTGFLCFDRDVPKAQSFISPYEWNVYAGRRIMPLSTFLRTSKELWYCDEPDRWHDIYGHVPFFADPAYVSMWEALGKLYIDAYVREPKLAEEVDKIIWFVTEIGLIEEDGELKALGATLYSSSGDLAQAYRPDTVYIPFSLDAILSLQHYDRSKLQTQFMTLRSLNEVHIAIEQFRKLYLS